MRKPLTFFTVHIDYLASTARNRKKAGCAVLLLLPRAPHCWTRTWLQQISSRRTVQLENKAMVTTYCENMCVNRTREFPILERTHAMKRCSHAITFLKFRAQCALSFILYNRVQRFWLFWPNEASPGWLQRNGRHIFKISFSFFYHLVRFWLQS